MLNLVFMTFHVHGFINYMCFDEHIHVYYYMYLWILGWFKSIEQLQGKADFILLVSELVIRSCVIPHAE